MTVSEDRLFLKKTFNFLHLQKNELQTDLNITLLEIICDPLFEESDLVNTEPNLEDTGNFK